MPSELSRENFISSHVKITCYLHTWRDHRRYGYIINRTFFTGVYVITYRVKLLNADWPRQRAFFLNHDQEGTFGNQERAWLLDADWLSTPALVLLVSRCLPLQTRFKRIFRNSPLLKVWSKHGYFILSWKKVNFNKAPQSFGGKGKGFFRLKLYWFAAFEWRRLALNKVHGRQTES